VPPDSRTKFKPSEASKEAYQQGAIVPTATVPNPRLPLRTPSYFRSPLARIPLPDMPRKYHLFHKLLTPISIIDSAGKATANFGRTVQHSKTHGVAFDVCLERTVDDLTKHLEGGGEGLSEALSGG